MPDTVQESDLIVFCIIFSVLWLASYLHIFRILVSFLIFKFLFRAAFPWISAAIMYFLYSKQ